MFGACAISAQAADSTEAKTLLDVYVVSREADPTLAIARYRVDGAEADKDVARGRLFPQISIFGDWSENKIRYEGNALSQLPSQDYPGERYGLQLRSPIFNMRSFRDYEVRGALVSQSEKELAVAETELLAAVVQAYLSVILAEESVSLFSSEVLALEQQFEEANALYVRSLIPVTELLDTQTRLDSLRADLVGARGQAAISRERLAQITGIRGLTLKPVNAKILLMSSITGAENAASLAIEYDPAIGVAEESLNAARKTIAREKGSWWPELDFVYNNQYSDVGFDNLTSPPRNSESYSISFRYPLFEGGAGSARIRSAWAEFYSAQQRLEAARRQAGGRARTAYVNLTTAAEREQAATQAARTAEISLDASRKAVRAGTARVTDVLLALAQSTRAKRDLNEAKFQRAMGWVELELAIGVAPESLAQRLSDALHGL